MLLRNSFSTTKKFFQKTIDNVKSLLSKGNSSSTYERLPKTPPFRPFSCGRDKTDHMDGDAGYNNNNELDNFYTEFTHQWDSNSRKSKLKSKVQKIKPSSIRTSSTKKSQQFYSLDHSSLQENCHFAAGTDVSMKTPEKNDAENAEILNSKRLNVNTSPGILKYSDLCSRSVREKRLSYVAEKLKELEKFDKENTDHKRDIEEFLHCYSRLHVQLILT
ncbi:Acyl transferase [Bienertia sinuspersici]